MERLLFLLLGLLSLVIRLLLNGITHEAIGIITVMRHLTRLEDLLTFIHEVQEEMILLLGILFMGNDIAAASTPTICASFRT